jgi:uroporphyrinogen-III synthase
VPDLTNVQALAATSAEGVRAFAQRNERRDLPLFVVGDASAEAARQLCFEDVRSAAGDAVALARLLGNLDPEDGAVLHLSGRDLARSIAVKGLEIRRVVLYAAEPAERFSEALLGALAADEIDLVLLFSARSAQIFAALMRQSRLPPRKFTALCLSPAIASALRGLCPTGIAERPTQSALLALIDQDAARRAK